MYRNEKEASTIYSSQVAMEMELLRMKMYEALDKGDKEQVLNSSEELDKAIAHFMKSKKKYAAKHI